MKFVLPGEEIASAEEFIPGDGVYDEDGVIKAYIIGRVAEDPKEHIINIIPSTTRPPIVEDKDTIIGMVKGLKDNAVLVRALYIEDKPHRYIAGQEEGSIHIANIRGSRIMDIRREFGIRDLIRAKVLRARPTIMLSTIGDEFGVIVSVCEKCNTIMKFEKQNIFKCPDCNSTKYRKIARFSRTFIPYISKDGESRVDIR